MERDERARGISGEGEQWHPLGLSAGSRDRGERRRFARLDSHASEVHCPAQVMLDDGLEQVADSHGRAARRKDEVCVI